MKKYGIKYIVLFLVIISALAILVSCDSGGGGGGGTPPDTITMNIGETPQITFSGQADGVMGFYIETGYGLMPSATFIVAANNSNPILSISISGSTTGDYTIESGDVLFNCSDAEGNYYSASQYQPETSGTVTITEYGAVGGNIVGTYSITADDYSIGSPPGSTVLITGDFTVKRGIDVTG